MRLTTPQPQGGAAWTSDMWEDWNRASPGDREMLLRLWGRPGDNKGG